MSENTEKPFVLDENRRDKALQFLILSDDDAANASAYKIGLEKQEKTILGMELLKLKGKNGTVAEKDAICRNSEAYNEWREKYENAVADYELIRNRRHTADTLIECWRSLNANRRQGSV